MNQQQAIALARTMAESLAAEIGGDYRVAEQTEDGVTHFWITDNPDIPEDGFDPSEATFFTATASHSPGKADVFIVEQSNTDGGGWVFIDADTCFETSF